MFAAGQTVEEVEPETESGPIGEELVEEGAFEPIEEEEGFEEAEWEDEDWDEDDDELLEDGDPEGDPGGEPVDEDETEPDDSDQGSERMDQAKRRVASATARAKALWMAGLKRVGDIRLPNHELDGGKVLIVSGVIAIVLMVGAAGYLIGKGTGEDIDAARLEGEFAGRRAGAVEGATKGYAAGFKKGRDIAFEKAYSASYRRNYRRAYEEAGMDPPKAKSIQVPEP